MFVITVLTSDDCEFLTTAVFDDENYEKATASALTETLLKTDKKPALILTYLPIFGAVGGDQMLMAIDSAVGGIPVFGTVAVDHNIDYSEAQTIFNGEMHKNLMVLSIICGDVDVSFEIVSLNEDKIRKQRAIITESRGSLLIGVNGKSVIEYLEEIGLKQTEVGMGIVPFVIGHKEGDRPIARAVIKFNEDGHAVCGGLMPEGESLSIGRVDAEDVLRGASLAFSSLADDSSGSVIICYSCLARFLSLGAGILNEAEKINKAANGISYQFAYGCGEICPHIDSNGKYKNEFHNYGLVLCKLR